ncbi:Transketolase [Mycobacteroides abscessus subsp. abscessus]|nr:Transketolase [Mycobacteroides abscessus subsp. abscessus]
MFTPALYAARHPFAPALLVYTCLGMVYKSIQVAQDGPMTDDHSLLQLHAARARRNVLRMLQANPSGHLGGAMSAIDMITAVYFHAMRPSSGPNDPSRDRFLLSAGHKAMGQYAVLAERGIIDASVLDQYGALSSPVPGHPNMSLLTGIEARRAPPWPPTTDSTALSCSST